MEGFVDVGRNCVGAHGDAGIEVFDLFLSAFGFFFSRLLLSCPFAISSSCTAIAAPLRAFRELRASSLPQPRPSASSIRPAEAARPFC